MSNFIEDCIHGRALLDDIDEYVERWHEGDSKLPLHAYLGMTAGEYSLWLSEPSVLPHIVVAHERSWTVEDVIEEAQSLPMAARADGLKKAADLVRWLKRQGLWSD